MKIFKHTFLVLALSFFAAQLQGQQTATVYYSMDYMKVAPSNVTDYLACEKAWKKIHAFKKQAGIIEGWALERVMSPTGTSTEYNFVTRQRYKDRNQLAAAQSKPFMPENWKSLLTADEIALVNRTAELRSYVKNEVWSAEERVLAPDVKEAKISVVNYFTMPSGVSRADHLKMERALWKPFHKSNMEQGKSKGWVLLNRELPMGSDYAYDLITVDLYTDMGQFWAPFDEGTFEKIHPGKSMNDIMKKSRSLGKRGSAEVRRSLDSTEE